MTRQPQNAECPLRAFRLGNNRRLKSSSQRLGARRKRMRRSVTAGCLRRYASRAAHSRREGDCDSVDRRGSTHTR